MDTVEETKAPRPTRRRWFIAGGVLLVLVAGPVLLLSLEVAQQWLVVTLAARYFDARIEVDTLGVVGDATVARVEVRDASAPADEASLLRLNSALADYSLFPGNGRFIRLLSAKEAEVNLVQASDGETNYGFLTRNKEQKSAEGSARFLPELIQIDALALEANMPRWSLRLQGIGAAAALHALDDASVEVHGEKATVAWRLAALGEMTREAQGSLELKAKRVDETLDAAGRLDFPDVATLTASVRHENAPDGQTIQVQVEEGVIKRAFWPSLISDAAGIPLDFAAMQVGPSHLAASQEQGQWRLGASHVEAHVNHLVLGAPANASSSLALSEGHRGAQSGSVALDAREDGETFEAVVKANVNGIAQIDGEVSLTPEGEAQRMLVTVRHAELEAAGLLDAVRAKVAMPVTFDGLSVTDSSLEALRGPEAFRLLRARFKAEGRGVEIPLGDTDWALGDVRAEGTGGEESGALLDAMLHLHGSGPHHVRLEGDFKNLSYTAEIAALPREALLAALPAMLRKPIQVLPALTGLEGKVQGTWSKPVYTIAGALRPGLEGVESASVDLDLQGDSTAKTLGGTVVAALGKQTVKADVKTGAGVWSVAADVAEAQPKDWLRLFSNSTALDTLSTLLTGKAGVSQAPDGAVALEVAAAAKDPRYGDLRLPDGDAVQVTGALLISPAKFSISGKTLELANGENFTATLGSYSYNWKNKTAKAGLDATADLAYVGAIFGKPELFGTLALKGPLALASDGVGLQFTANSESVGYGAWSTPYNVPAEATGTLAYTLANKHWSISPLNVRVGDANSLAIDTLASTGIEITAGSAILQTDLSPLVSKGFLATVEGGAAKVEAANVRIADGKIQGEFVPDVRAAVLALPKRFADFENVQLTGRFAYTDTLSGSGTLATNALTTAGVRMSGFHSNVAVDANRFRIDNIVTTLFGGETRAVLTVAPFEEGFPVRLEATVTNGDLAAFTREFKPPQVSLTGIFSGDLMIEYAGKEIRDFRAVLRSEQDFSLNRDLLERVVKAELTKGLGVKVIESVIGEEAQRPFDAASMDLRFEDGRIVGTALLESRQLNLTIDVLVDPETIFAAMALRQEQAPQDSGEAGQSVQ